MYVYTYVHTHQTSNLVIVNHSLTKHLQYAYVHVWYMMGYHCYVVNN